MNHETGPVRGRNNHSPRLQFRIEQTRPPSGREDDVNQQIGQAVGMLFRRLGGRLAQTCGGFSSRLSDRAT